MGEQMKILIVKMSAIGDVIHTLPALNAVRKKFPKACITWLVEEDAADIVLGHQALDRVIVSKRKKWIKKLFSGEYYHSFRQIRLFINQLRDTHYDMIIDFQNLFKSGVMVMLARGSQKIGFDKGMEHSENSHVFYNKKIAPVSMEIHALKRGLILLESLGIYCKKIEYHLPLTQKDRLDIDKVLKLKGIKKEKSIICINPQATWPTKLWKPEKFAALSDRLNKEFNAQIVFTGADADKDEINTIISMMKTSAINLAGLTTLKMLAALYEKTACLVTTDTGPMHLAAAMGTKIAAIFGPTAPWRTGPYGSSNFIIRSPLLCSPCFKRQCTSKQCMEKISVADVMQGVNKLMGERI